jgi:hypothetical protein
MSDKGDVMESNNEYSCFVQTRSQITHSLSFNMADTARPLDCARFSMRTERMLDVVRLQLQSSNELRTR